VHPDFCGAERRLGERRKKEMGAQEGGTGQQCRPLDAPMARYHLSKAVAAAEAPSTDTFAGALNRLKLFATSDAW